MSRSFIADTSYSGLRGVGDYKSMIIEILKLLNESTAVAGSKADELLYTSGKNRVPGQDIFRLDNNEESYDLSNLSLKGYEVISEYINTAPENKAKSLLIYLLNSGVLYQIIGELNITRADWADRIFDYFSKAQDRSSDYLEEFYKMVPEAYEFGHDQIGLNILAANNLIASFENYANNGGFYSPEVRERFVQALKDLRDKVRKNISPTVEVGREIFGSYKNGEYKPMSRTVYTRYSMEARVEVSQLLDQIS